MKLLEQYISQLPKETTNSDWKFSVVGKNILWLNPNCKDILLEDLVRIDFNNLYPNIIVGLYNEGLIDTKWESDINQLKSFLENIEKWEKMSTDVDHLVYKTGRTHANLLYGKIKSSLIDEYLHQVYTDLIEKYRNDIVYIDVDMIICKRDIDISTIPSLRYEVSKLEYFYIESLKKYIIFANGQLETKGHSKFTNKDLLQLVKSEIRTRRLNKIGI